MGLIRQKSELKHLSILGKKSQIIEYYSLSKLSLPMRLSSIGVMILTVNCFFHMEPQIPVASWLHIWVAKKIVYKIKTDTQVTIVIMDADINEETFVWINPYNANTETEQIKTICEFDQLLGDSCLDSNKKIIFAREFKLIFWYKSGGISW